MNSDTVCLFYQDVYLKEFDATVVSCESHDEYYEIILDQTAFYPEGGGQNGDQGYLFIQKTVSPDSDTSGIHVADTYYRDRLIAHRTEHPIEPGTAVHGVLDWSLRFRRMQEHTGEHIVSGIIHSRYGHDNVGFHMNDRVVTIDYNGPVPKEDLPEIELACHRAVVENLPVDVHYHTEEEASALSYRSKKELHGQIRIVTVPGIDDCACCGTHTARTGEVGSIHFTDIRNHKGGVRMTLVIGERAVEDAITKEAALQEISNLLSEEKDRLPDAVQALLSRENELELQLTALRRSLCDTWVAAAEETFPFTHIHISEIEMDRRSLIYLADEMKRRFSGISLATAAFQDDTPSFVLLNPSGKLKPVAEILRKQGLIRGGGSDVMIQGEILTGTAEFLETLNHLLML